MKFLLIQDSLDRQSHVRLSDFIDALRIPSEEGLEEFKLSEFRIKNFVHLYEEVEERVQENEVETTNKKYAE